jgi:uncharacterized cupin superfamily protein
VSWFVVNAREAAWERSPSGDACYFEREGEPFEQLGVNLRVLHPGTRWLYHAESAQEDFLVLAGACLLLVEGEERPLRAWDFVHCPAGTAHAFVVTGDEPCVILMAGARHSGASVRFPRSELAVRHGAGGAVETTSYDEAQAGVGAWTGAPPDEVGRLPWR